MPAPFHRLFSLAILLFWMAPSLGASITALHVALDHHGAHGAEHAEEHAEEIANLARAATHGHHHDATAPEHEHEASLAAPSPLPKPLAAFAITRSAPLALSGPGERSRIELRSRRGPPNSLFSNHCSLLL